MRAKKCEQCPFLGQLGVSLFNEGYFTSILILTHS